jgi:hypothetical protein
VKTFTSHLKPDVVPVLLPEGFSLWAALFGWLWLFRHRAWIPGVLILALGLVLMRLPDSRYASALLLGLMLLQGLFGRDMVRWSLGRRGYTPGPIVAARDEDAALGRLLTEQPALLRGLTPAQTGSLA